MSIRLRGTRYHDRFKINGVTYAGPCVESRSFRAAELFEEPRKQEIRTETARISTEKKKIRQNNLCNAFFDNVPNFVMGRVV